MKSNFECFAEHHFSFEKLSTERLQKHYQVDNADRFSKNSNSILGIMSGRN